MGKGDALRVLIAYYSFSGQTNSLLNALVSGLKQQGLRVTLEKIRPMEPLRFPVGTISATIKMMLITFFRHRVAVKDLSSAADKMFDLAILAGPTWSYNPSGPVLSFLDRDGRRLFEGKDVLPLISCRGYWRMHCYGLKKKLVECGAAIPNVVVFAHPSKEPWRTLGVFLKIAGKSPERGKTIGKYYTKYGHSKEQFAEAKRFGVMIGEALQQGKSLAGLNFKTPKALP